jgi:hypothetical protein
MALVPTQPLMKMSTRNIPGGKGGRCARLTTSPPSRAECHEIWDPKPAGTLWATLGLLRDSFAFDCLYVCYFMRQFDTFATMLGAPLRNTSYSLVTKLWVFYSMTEYLGYAKIFFTFKMSQCKMVHACMCIFYLQIWGEKKLLCFDFHGILRCKFIISV